jgi:hypothetical protein
MRAHEFIFNKQVITELNMTPISLMKFAQSPDANNMKAGFEAKLLLNWVKKMVHLLTLELGSRRNEKRS